MVLKYDIVIINQITLNDQVLEGVKTVTYLNSTIGKQGGSDADAKVGIDKSKTTFLLMKNNSK